MPPTLSLVTKPVSYSAPQQPVIELSALDSDLDLLVDGLMSHHWTADKVRDGWLIDRAVLKAAFARHIEQLFDSYINIYTPDDHMHGRQGVELQHHIVEMADKVAKRRP